jgi:hypothetical protein
MSKNKSKKKSSKYMWDKQLFTSLQDAMDKAEEEMITDGIEEQTIYEIKAVHTLRRTIDFTTEQL